MVLRFSSVCFQTDDNEGIGPEVNPAQLEGRESHRISVSPEREQQYLAVQSSVKVRP